MPDEGTQEVQETSTEEQTSADSQSEQQTEETTSQTDSGEEGDKSSEQTAEQKASDTTEQNQDKQEQKPLSRRSAAYRIQQLVEENKSLRKQVKPKEQQDDDWNEESRADEQPDIAGLVAKEVDKRLNPVITESSKVADDAEINELFAGNPADRSQFEGKIRSMWNLPQYKDVAAADLLNMLRGNEMEKTIAKAKQEAIEDYKKAQQEAKDSSASGNSNSNRTGKSGKTVADMTDAELLAHNERVKAGLPV